MTVNTELARATFAWTGVETSFACGFPADKVADLVVFFRTVAGVQSQLTIGVNYNATLAAGTKIATVTPIAMPAATGTVTVTRRTPALVSETLVDGQDFSNQVIQALHDKAAMRSAEDRTRLSRSLVLEETAEIGSGSYDAQGSSIRNAAPGATANSLATVAQLQEIAAAGGNVPVPVVGQTGWALIVTGEGTYAWLAIREVPAALLADVGKPLVVTAAGVYGFSDATILRVDATQAHSDANKARGRSNLAALGLNESGLRNLLINSSFRINQRAFAGGTLAAGVYGHDRWKAGAAGCTYTVSGGVATITAGALAQVVEGLSIENSGDHVINWTGTATCTVDGVARVKGDTVALTAGSNATVAFAGGTVSKMQLEFGKATAFEQRPIALELQLCKRYFESIELAYLPGISRTSADAMAAWQFEVRKRATPTLAYAGTLSDFKVIAGNSVYSNTLVPTFEGASPHSVLVKVNVGSSLSAGGGAIVSLNDTARITASAEL